jgi:hypothetical protein
LLVQRSAHVSWDKVSGAQITGIYLITSDSLTYSELYLTLTYIIRRYNFELYDTDFTDIETVSDYGMPLPRADSKGVRVKVL